MDVIKHPINTEKSIRIMESENKITFNVNTKANKKDIKEAVEKEYKVKVIKVNTQITSKGQKKAYVKLSAETAAIDLATQLGIM